jgi:hypothetical protein
VLKEELSLIFVSVPYFYNTFFRDITGLDEEVHLIFRKCKEGDYPLYNDGIG